KFGAKAPPTVGVDISASRNAPSEHSRKISVKNKNGLSGDASLRAIWSFCSALILVLRESFSFKPTPHFTSVAIHPTLHFLMS
ncbi:MAG: hypothetical protein ACK4I8_03140, partial [Armatimonadota bacterium]